MFSLRNGKPAEYHSRMTLKEDFEKASKDVVTLKNRPNHSTLKALYALYKQATEGDAKGDRPGFLDVTRRAKFDAWAEKKGTTTEAAMQEYIALVKSLS